MAIILNNKKSTYSSPSAYYTLEYTNTSNRTATSVDVTFKITSNLASSSSRLGTGYTLKANIYLNNSWSEDITLKASNESWSGTTKHYKTITLTIDDLSSTDTELTNVKFRVVSSASDRAAGLNSTDCSNIEIPIGHTPPSNITYTMLETNTQLGTIDDNLIVEKLSIKKFIVNYTLYDNAEVVRVGIYNDVKPYSTTSFTITGENQLEFTLDCSLFDFYKENNKIPMVVRVIDSFETQGTSSDGSNPDLYNYIPYQKPYIEQSTSVATRDGQTSGKVNLTINGIFYNTTQIPQELSLYYKFWEYDGTSTEGGTWTLINTINIDENTFNVTNLPIGETATNWFDPEKAYRVKVRVIDKYNTYTMTEALSIPVGESIWDEYKDHVDFKKLTTHGIEVDGGTVAWENSSISSFDTQNITLNTDNYDFYEFIFINKDDEDIYYNTGKIPKGHGTRLIEVYAGGGGVTARTREVTYVDDKTFTIQTGRQASGSTASAVNNNIAIPVYVIVYKSNVLE